jgi:hypothetical protein
MADVRAAMESVFLPERREGRALPRFDYLIMAVVAVVGALLVLADIFQRTLASHPMNQLNIDGHNNPETWFHSTVLVGAALAALLIAFTFVDNAHRIAWLVLGAGIGFFSMDKTISLHEHVGAKLVAWLNLPEDSERVAWEMAWSPIILVVVAALLYCVWGAGRRTQLWSGGLLLAGAVKIVMEGLTFPAVHWLGASETHGWFYGIEANVEESFQLLAFACLFAGLAQYGVERLVAFARDEIPSFDAAQEPLALPASIAARLTRGARTEKTPAPAPSAEPAAAAKR